MVAYQAEIPSAATIDGGHGDVHSVEDVPFFHVVNGVGFLLDGNVRVPCVGLLRKTDVSAETVDGDDAK